MGKKRKAFHLDESLSAEQKVEKLVEQSVKKAATKDWNAAENMARKAVALARESFYRDEGHILHAKSNLQLGIVNLSRGHYAQARKPIEIAQKIAESNNDHWFRAKVYGAQADLCFIQKRKNNDFHQQGKKFRYLQEKEEEKARQKEFSGGPAAQHMNVTHPPLPPGTAPPPLPPYGAASSGPAYEPPPPPGGPPPLPPSSSYGNRNAPPPYLHNRYHMGPPQPPPPHVPGMRMAGMMPGPDGVPVPVYLPPQQMNHGSSNNSSRFAPNPPMPMQPPTPSAGAIQPPPQPAVPVGTSNANANANETSSAAAAPDNNHNGSASGGGSAGQTNIHAAAVLSHQATAPSPSKKGAKTETTARKKTSTGAATEMIWKEDITSMEERRALHSKYSTPTKV
jgi:hypothetical protein